jgi:hypothetical protein
MSNVIGGEGSIGGRRVSDGAFDSAVTAVARKRNGDAVTPELFWDVVLALDVDSKRREEGDIERHREMTDLLEGHITAEQEHDSVIREEIIGWRANHVAIDHAPLPQAKADRDWEKWGWRVKATVAIGSVLGIAAIDQIVRMLSHVTVGYP